MTAVAAGEDIAPPEAPPPGRARPAARTVRLLAAGSAAAYAAALTLPWVRAAIGPSLWAGDLPVQLPGLGRSFGATWFSVVIVCAVLQAGVALVPARLQAVTARVAAAVSVASIGGFLLMGSFADFALRQQLLEGQEALDAVRRMVGYRIPRPSVTTLGPVELPASASALASALRGGFLLALLAATVSVALWLWTRRAAVDEPAAPAWTAWVPRLVSAALAAVVLLVAVQGWRASTLYDRAGAEVAEGQSLPARADVTTAISLNGTLRASPDVQQLLAGVATATGTGTQAQQFYGRSLLARDAGQSDDALEFAVRAAKAAPGEPAYAGNVCRQASARAASPAGIDVVRAVVPVSQRCDQLMLQLTASELIAGRNDLVGIDGAQLSHQTPDGDIRSAALTMLARAKLAAGDLVAGRNLLEQARAADPNDINVVARSLATGLYSAGR